MAHINEIQPELLQHYLDGTISEEGLAKLFKSIKDSGLNHDEVEKVLETAYYQSLSQPLDIPYAERQQLLTALLIRMNTPTRADADAGVLNTTRVHRIHFLKMAWFRYAAAILLLAGAATYLYQVNRPLKEITFKKPTVIPDIEPGGNKAILTLSDGSTIILDSAANGKIANQGQTQVVKLTNGQVAYNTNGSNTKEVMWNTVSTPKGGQYQVTLPDGTMVWLNASSSITFPIAFVSGRREVKIKGEVYFEVAVNKQKPFFADVDGKSVVEVLGTRFNVNAYPDEGTIKTTLLEGRVNVKADEINAILIPGQQAQISPQVIATYSDRSLKSPGSDVDHRIIVTSNVDLDQTLAWKNGLFSFNNADLRSVMRQLERWYDIKVQYQDAVSTVSLKGKMYRNVSLSTILEFLRKMGVKFRMEGKTVIVL